MPTFVIPKKTFDHCISDLASNLDDRDIIFSHGCKYAVVFASFYGGKGYTTHRTVKGAIAASRRSKDYAHEIIDAEGNKYAYDYAYTYLTKMGPLLPDVF